jgi:hypothetical protein
MITNFVTLGLFEKSKTDLLINVINVNEDLYENLLIPQSIW